MIIKIRYFLGKYKITQYFLDLLSYLKRKLTVKKINKDLLINIEGISDYNIPIEWFYEKKKNGISGVARLKNAEHFLEKCMESYLEFLDELILVDNMSDDKTRNICKEFKNRYPNKVYIYQYPHKVFPPSNENYKIPANSVHSLAYYYNRCFSKTSYSHVVKVDDDMLMIKEKCLNVRKKSLGKYKNRYNVYYGINLARDDKGKYCTIKGQEYAGRYGDHGIYPVSPYAYYIQGSNWEVLCNNYHFKRHGFAFLHLKLLKPNYGLHNLNKEYKKFCEKRFLKSINNYDFNNILGNEKSINIEQYYEEIK